MTSVLSLIGCSPAEPISVYTDRTKISWFFVLSKYLPKKRATLLSIRSKEPQKSNIFVHYTLILILKTNIIENQLLDIL